MLSLWHASGIKPLERPLDQEAQWKEESIMERVRRILIYPWAILCLQALAATWKSWALLSRASWQQWWWEIYEGSACRLHQREALEHPILLQEICTRCLPSSKRGLVRFTSTERLLWYGMDRDDLWESTPAIGERDEWHILKMHQSWGVYEEEC